MRKRFGVSLSLIFMLALFLPIAGQPFSVNSVDTQAEHLSGSSDPPYSEFTVPLYVNGFDDTKTGWTRVGASPYLGAIDYPSSYIYQTLGENETYQARIGDFYFEDVASYDGGKVFIEIFGCSRGPGDDMVEVWLYNQTLLDYSLVDTLTIDKTWSWKSTVDVSATLNTVSKINDAKVYLVKKSTGLEDQVMIDAMRLVPELKLSDFRSTNYYTDLSVTDPTKAYDNNIGTYASFVYSSVSGTQKGIELFNFASPVQYPGLNSPPLPSIDHVDFHMRYNTSLNTGNLNDKYRIVYYVSPSTTAQVLTDWRTDNATYLYVNGFDDTKTGWTRVGASPYLGAIDYPSSYINQSLKVPIIRPDGDGTFKEWSIYPTTPTTHYDKVNEAVSDGDTTYIKATAGNLKESFSLQNPPTATWGIGKVRLTLVARQETVLSPPDYDRIRLILVIGGTTYNGSIFTQTKDYLELWSDWTSNPATGSAWTWTDISSLEAGVWSEAFGTWDGEIRVTQLYVEIFPEEKIGDFSFPDVTSYDGGKVFIELYAKQPTPPLGDELDAIQLWLYDQGKGDFFLVDTLTPTNGTWSWVTSVDLSSILNTVSQINAAKVYLLKETFGKNATNIEIDAMRIKVHNPDYIYESMTVNWPNQPEPNDGVWNWTDLQNIRFAVETQAVTGTSDHGCTFWLFEAWVTVAIPKAKLMMQNIKDPTLTPTSLTLRPNGDGFYKQWKVFPATPTTHYDKVNEATHDGDTTFIYDNTGPARRDTFDLEDPAAQTWEIGSVRVVAYARYTVATADEKLFGLLYFPGLPLPTPMPYTSSKYYTLSTSYQKYSWDWGINPYTNSPWDWSDLTNLQAGVASLRTGMAWDGELRVTQLYVEVVGPRISVDIVSEGVEDFWGYTVFLNYSTSILTATATDYHHSIIRPDGDGTFKEWSIYPTTPTTHYDKVNESYPDKDAAYIKATAGNLKESFSLQNPPTANWLIGGVELTVVARQITGNEKVRLMLVIGGTTYNGSIFSPTSTYNYYRCNWTNNPATGSAWTWTDISSLEAGVWSEAFGTWAGEIRITQLYLTVKSHFTDATPSSINDAQGYLSFGYNMPMGSVFGTSGNITCGRVYFVPDGLGWSPLGMYNTKLVNSKAGVIPHRALSAIFENLPGAAPVEDAAVLTVTPSASVAYQGYPRDVSVDVKNEGTVSATFDVTVFYNGSSMGTQTVTSLAPGATATLTFTWDTTGVSYGNYVISAFATTLKFEVDTADNSLSDGTVTLTIPGDIDGDGYVGSADFSVLAGAYGSSSGQPAYDVRADIDGDGYVGSADFSVLAGNYGKSV